jgi:hypothetical protein
VSASMRSSSCRRTLLTDTAPMFHPSNVSASYDGRSRAKTSLTLLPGMRGRNVSRLLKSDASPPGRDGHVRDKDAGSARSSATCATEDAVSRRPVRSGGLAGC